MQPEVYSEFPPLLIIIRAGLLIAVFINGLIITYNAAIVFYSFLFLVVLILIFTLSCVCKYCYYFGKYCDKGFGKLAKVIFRNNKVDYKKFQFYGNICTVLIIIFLLFPIVYGVAISFTTFSRIYLALTLLSIALGIVYILTQQLISCRHCAMNKYCGIYIK